MVSMLVFPTLIEIGSYGRENREYRAEAERVIIYERYAAEKQYVLKLINEARREAGVPSVSLGDNLAAQIHAETLRNECTVSHWHPNGWKPYMRYSHHGGYQINAENVVGYTICPFWGGYVDVQEDLRNHVNDLLTSPGHRETILYPVFSNVNLGIAIDRGTWLVQQFEGNYVNYQSRPQLNDGTLTLKGQLLNGARMDEDGFLLLTHDPPPTPLTVGQLVRLAVMTKGHQLR